MNRDIAGPTDEQRRLWDEQGYYIVRDVIPHDLAMEIRGVIRNTILNPDLETDAQTADPMDPMNGDDAAARAARFRKLGGLAFKSPVMWDAVYSNPAVLEHARALLGDDLLVKFAGCFLKPAKTGSATPWHQDNGLWRDGETQPFNFWMAIDPATKDNGCLQFIPGTHREPIDTHVLYEGGIHGELPRERVEQMKAKHGLVHIELEPGSFVCWHSSLYHYSPPNPSPKSRIAIAGVISSYELAQQSRVFKTYHWAMRGGEAQVAFPPQQYTAPGEPLKVGPWPKAGDVAAVA